jgi:hypothetical protein
MYTRRTLRHVLNPRCPEQSSWYCCTGIRATLPWSTSSRRLVQPLREAGSVTPTALVNAGRPETVRTPADEDATVAAVE